MKILSYLSAGKLKISKEIERITKLQTSTTKDLTRIEFVESQKQFEQQKTTTFIWIMISAISSILLVASVLYFKNRSKKQKTAFQNILKQIDQKNATDFPTEIPQTQNKNEFDKEIENEEKIVKNLEKLEEKHFFTKQNISAAQLALMLKISPRNLSFILKKYRNDDFYNYLNTMRINLITAALRDNPKFQKFKISALGEMCGYSSHSQFTVNFKAKTGISPSQYIQFLEKEKYIS